MKKVETVFLAGPDGWGPEAGDLRGRREALCAGAGFRALTPRLGEGLEEEGRSELAARSLYAEALGDLRKADALIANLTPWRGPSCDPATAFLAGFASALKKPVFAYLNIQDEEEADLRGRIERVFGAGPDLTGRWRDALDCEIEDFYLPETLMLWAEARRFYVIMTPEPLTDLHGFEFCLEALRAYSDFE